MRNKLFIIMAWMVASFVLGLGVGSLVLLNASDQERLIKLQSKTLHENSETINRQSKTISNQSETIKRQSTVIRDLYDRLSLIELD